MESCRPLSKRAHYCTIAVVGCCFCQASTMDTHTCLVFVPVTVRHPLLLHLAAMLRAMRAAEPPQPHIWQGIGRPRVTPVHRDTDTVATPLLVLRTKAAMRYARGPRTHRSTSTRKIGSCSARSKIAIRTFARSPHHPTSRADCHVLSARAPAAICVAVRRQLPPKPGRYGTDTSPRLLLSTALCRPVLTTESLRWSILLQPVEKKKRLHLDFFPSRHCCSLQQTCFTDLTPLHSKGTTLPGA